MTNRKAGRPTIYTHELALEICETISTYKHSLIRMCAEIPHFPSHDTLHKWKITQPGFGDMYREAKDSQQDIHAEYILEVADDEDVEDARAKRMIESRKWLMGKMAPKRYAEKVQQEITLGKHEDWLKKLE